MASRNSAILAGASTPDSSTKPSRCIASSRWAVRVVSCMSCLATSVSHVTPASGKRFAASGCAGTYEGDMGSINTLFGRSHAAWERLLPAFCVGAWSDLGLGAHAGAWAPSTSTSGSAHDLQTTLPIALALHLDLHRDALMHFRHVADHRHLASLGLQRVQCVHGDLQRLGVEAAEAFVDEQRFDPE